MAVAYLINQYPRVSHSFVRREVLAIEALGERVVRIALKGWEEQVVDAQDREERRKTEYVLRRHRAALVLDAVAVMLRAPIRWLRALAMSVEVSLTSDRSRLSHIAYLIEACTVLRWIAKSDVRHLHAHFGTNSAEIAMYVRLLGGPPYSFTVHGQDELNSGGIAAKVRLAKFVVAISSFGRAQLLRRVDYPDRDKIRVIHCGLSDSYLDAQAAPISDVRSIVCVARLSKEKGHLTLLAATEILHSEGIDFELVLVGDGELRDVLAREIVEKGLRQNVIWTGSLDETGVRKQIERARVLVLPSYSEGMPIVVMEAMALARPVVATYVGGLPELVVPEETGWLVPAASPQALAKALREALGLHVDKLREMGNSGRQRVLRRHSAAVSARRLLDAFQR